MLIEQNSRSANARFNTKTVVVQQYCKPNLKNYRKFITSNFGNSTRPSDGPFSPPSCSARKLQNLLLVLFDNFWLLLVSAKNMTQTIGDNMVPFIPQKVPEKKIIKQTNSLGHDIFRNI